MWMVGGESRKSNRPSAVIESRASTNSCCAFGEPDISSENTNLNRLTSCIARNTPNNGTAQGKRVSWRATAITSSENAGDTIVDSSFVRTAGRWSPGLRFTAQAATWRDRRTLRGDRSRSSVYHQRKFMDGQIRGHSLAKSSIIPNRSVSKVSAQASNKIGTQHALPPRSM